MNYLTNIQSDIQNTLKSIHDLTKIKTHLVDLNQKISEKKEKLKIIDKSLEKELKDIENLETLGVKSLFHSVLGSKEEQLDKERQEYLEASLKFKEYSNQIKVLEYEKSLISNKVDGLESLTKKLEVLKSQRQNEILKNNSNKKIELLNILNQIENCSIIKKEIGEAIIEGSRCIKILNVVSSYLKKARDWGNWQQRSRRSYNKNRAIDLAINNLSKAQVQLDIFLKELSDLGNNNITLQLSRVQFNQFTDFFFDNLISDWIVQQRIKSTMTNVESVLDKIQRIVLSLNNEESNNDKKLSNYLLNKNKILLE